VVKILSKTNHRDTENTEVAQRRFALVTWGKAILLKTAAKQCANYVALRKYVCDDLLRAFRAVCSVTPHSYVN